MLMNLRQRIWINKKAKNLKDEIKRNETQIGAMEVARAEGIKADQQTLRLGKRLQKNEELLFKRYHIETKEGKEIRALETQLKDITEIQKFKEQIGKELSEDHKEMVIQIKSKLQKLRENRDKLFEVK